MNPFTHFYNMKLCLVDLSLPSVDTLPLDPGLVQKHIGGAAMNRALLHEHGDALILGTGPLTGSFVPASSLLIATYSSPIFTHVCHVPFMLRTGPAMKFSGIDFLIVKGIAPEPSILYIDRGAAEVRPAKHFLGLPVRDVVKELKKESPALRTALVTGPAADQGITCASVSVDTHGSPDKTGMAFRMNERNLKGIVFSGTGGLPFGSDNPDQAKELIQRISTGKDFKSRGFVSVLNMLNAGKEAGKIVRKLKKKDMACYNCPSPCMTHFSSAGHDFPLLLHDHVGWIAMAKKAGDHALPLFHRCLQAGLDPAGVAQALPDGGTMTELLSIIDKLLQETTKVQTAGAPLQCPEIPSKNHALFGGGIAPIPPGDEWNGRVSLAMVLGICPLFLLRFPGITDTDLLGFISRDESALATLRENLASSILSALSD
jgi:aldehyde:ferredoxin oxidoreductase